MADTPHTKPPAGPKITAVVVDDSAVVRKHLADTLTAGGIEVIATAGDPLFAWPKMQAQWPDVVVLDVEMPRMDGITFLRQIMRERPTPVVMCSTLTAAGANTTLEALAEGAVGFVTKPKMGLREFLEGDQNGLVPAVRAAARARVRLLVPPSGAPQGGAGLPAPLPKALPLPPDQSLRALHETTERVVAIGSSTGGVQAIETLLRALPRTAPGILVVQHMPATFTAALAERLNRLCAVEVREAADGDRLVPGRVLIAPGGRHMQLRRSGAHYVVAIKDGPLVNRHKPSVDVLFKSVAIAAGRNAAGIILTGMGDDGARGLLEMRTAGAATVAQDEATSVVYGMPREATKLGAAERELPLSAMASWLLRQGGGVAAAPAELKA
ncbi:MAG: chemotaxis response regulator protein-glutamate methylesterase [Rubrivivax sp.]|jgi:two-component system chemotaxis response regulator CheB